MKIKIDTLKYWLGPNIKINKIIKNLTFLGFESFKERNTLNISIPHNRINCNNLFDIINELSGFIDFTFFNKKKDLFNVEKKSNIEFFEIKNKNKNFCYAYSFILIKNINNTLEVSNEIKDLLISNKITPINFIVDTLNYITLITGQPLHAYDYDDISNKLIIDRLKQDQIFFTINENKINLKKNTFIIKDDKNNILSMPGIIGSNISKIKTSSKNILIENAIFNKKFIGKLSNLYNIKTLSSEIFSRGINIKNREITTNLVISLLNIKNPIYSEKIYKDLTLIKNNINLYKKNILNILGFFITDNSIENALKNRNFIFEKFDNYWKIEIPYNRYDITIEANIISEILKYHGYNKISEKPLKNNTVSISYNKKNANVKKIHDYLYYSGFNEVINYTFINSELEEKIFKRKTMILKNPLSDAMNGIRPNLMQGLLKNISSNINRSTKSLKIFEIGNVWTKKNTKSELQLTCVCTDILHFKDLYDKECSTYFILKSLVENILTNILQFKKILFKKNKNKYTEEQFSTSIFSNSIKIGSIGLVNENILKVFDIKENIYFFEMNLSKIKNKKNPAKFRKISKFPRIERDVSFIVISEISYYDLFTYIKLSKIENLQKFFLINIYYINKDNKSITIRFTFQSLNKTLLDDNINIKINILCNKIKKKFSATIKGL